jgi:phage FluMu gp28-like protein
MCIDTGEIFFYKRLNKTDYRTVLEIIERTCKRYNSAPLIFDATGVGTALSDMLRDYDVSAHPFIFTNESKGDLITKLALAIEYANIKIPNIETIVNELSSFTYTLTKTQKISFAAPSGMHDDCVMSIAMANLYRTENQMSATIATIDDILQVNNKNNRPKSFFEFMDDDNLDILRSGDHLFYSFSTYILTIDYL